MYRDIYCMYVYIYISYVYIYICIYMIHIIYMIYSVCVYIYRPGDQAPWKTATWCIILEAGPPLTNQRISSNRCRQITPRRRPTRGTVITKRKKNGHYYRKGVLKMTKLRALALKRNFGQILSGLKYVLPFSVLVGVLVSFLAVLY